MHRLTAQAQFEAVLAGGRTVSRTPHFALHRLDFAAPPAAADAPASAAVSPLGAFGRQTDCAWLGVVVPKRWARRAVTRNTIRRQIYAVAAAHAGPWPPAAHVVRLKGGFDRAQFTSATSDLLKAAVRAELQQLFGRMPVPVPAPAA